MQLIPVSPVMAVSISWKTLATRNKKCMGLMRGSPKVRAKSMRVFSFSSVKRIKNPCKRQDL